MTDKIPQRIRLSVTETRNCDKRSYKISDEVPLLNIEHFKKDFGCCPGIQRYSIYDFYTIYNTIRSLKSLDTYQKNILLVRLNRICTFIKNKYNFIRFYYTASKIYVIVTGIINPALLSINVQSDTVWYDYVYWLVWILQIAVSLVTALSSFYKWDKKYFAYKAYKTKIEQEMWLFLELIGRYSTINSECTKETSLGFTTHETKINLFLFRLEYLFKKLKDADLDIEITEDESSKDSKNSANNRPPADKEELERFTPVLGSTTPVLPPKTDKNKITQIAKIQRYVKKYLKRVRDKGDKTTEGEEGDGEEIDPENPPEPTEV